MSTTVDDRIIVRGHDLADELIGRRTFTEMFLLDLHGTPQPARHVELVDAVLVTLMEHGITPSTLAARVVLDGAPESTQGAVAAGLLATGSRFLGVIEEVATLVQDVAASDDGQTIAARRVYEHQERGTAVPGFGHNLHSHIDPRVDRLLELAGPDGRHVRALRQLHGALVEATGRPLIANAAGVIGAILSDLGYAPEDVRGFALVARCAGLVAHIADERRSPMGRRVWQQAHDRGTAGARPPNERERQEQS